MANTSVDDWLRSLGLLNYVQAFIDNGYDDLDICKQIGDEDLDAIGVINAKDRRDILTSVQSLKDQGVNAVYFELESNPETTVPKYVGPTDREKYGRDELIRKMKSLLLDDNCVLPENNVNAEHDPLDDLAQYYADQLYTYFQDVKEVLEHIRDDQSDEESNEVAPRKSKNHESPKHVSPSLPKKKGNAKLLQEKGLSKSLSSLDQATAVKNNKGSKSPKHGISRLFSGKKKNYVQVPPPKISVPMERVDLMSSVHMSEDDRKSLMLQVKHGDITQEEALKNFWSYEVTQIIKDQEKENEKDKQPMENKPAAKKKKGIFNRSSFKRRSSGQSSEILAADIQLGERDRMELMRKIKNKEITTEEAWEQLRRFGNKREGKKSPKLSKGSKSPKQRERERISASSVQLFSSTFYAGTNTDFSQSTSNIPSAAGSDSSPDSTPGLPRKLDLQQGYANSAEQLGSNGSIEFDPKIAGNYSSRSGIQKRSPSPKMPNADLRRVVSEKRGSKEPAVAAKRRSTLSNIDSNRSSTSSLHESGENIDRQTPSPPVRKPPRLPPNKPSISPQDESRPKSNVSRTSSYDLEGKKPKLPEKPALPAKPIAKPILPPKPPVKPQKITAGEKSNSLSKKVGKVPLVTLVNGLPNESSDNTGTRTNGEVTSQQTVDEKPRVPPRRPSPATRVSRNKPSGTKLLEMIETKLEEEGIDLTQEPYSNQDGKWGVPMSLIDRYSFELQSTMREVTKEMDHIRIEKLNHTANKMAIPCDIANLRFAPDVVGKLSSVVDWLTSLGLPMYIDNLIEEGYDDMHTIPYLSQEHLNYANITNPEHINRLIRSLENMAPDTESCSED